MSEILIPPWIIPESETHEWLDDASSAFRSAFAPGLAQRQSYGGIRLKLSRRHTVRAEEKAQLLSALKATRGSYNALRTKVHFVQRGSFNATELLSNNTFADGTTGWTSSSDYSISVADRILRARRAAVTGAPNALVNLSSIGVTQYAPYVFRACVLIGRGAYTDTFQLRIGASSGSSEYGIESGLQYGGVHKLAGVPYGTTVYVTLLDGMSSGVLPNDFFGVPYISLSRCPLVDNGGNSLLRSDELNDSAWTKTRSSVTANSIVAPDGTTTSDAIVEDSTASNSHYISQDIATLATTNVDFVFACALRASSRTIAYLNLDESVSGHSAYAFFNLSSGAIGTVAANGANWANARAYISPLGNSWYYCCVIARKVSAATTVTGRIGIATADGSFNYSGNGSSNVTAWRATIKRSSVPVRLTSTTSVAASSVSQTGNALHLKGLPSSTSGLLLPGDWIEINGEIKQAAASLDSDASGLGYLQFEPPLVRSPADSDPVNITDPMGRFLVSNVKIDNEFGTQARVSYDLEHIYE